MSDPTPQNEVRYVLGTLEANWPGEEYPDHLARIDRDEPEILETGERTKSLELTKWNAVGASLSDRITTPRGAEYDHDVETVVSIRVEGLTSQSGQWGHIDSSSHFESLVRHIQRALLLGRSYPDVTPDADDLGYVTYMDLRVENERDLSAESRDYFRRDFDVRLTGIEQLPRP